MKLTKLLLLLSLISLVACSGGKTKKNDKAAVSQDGVSGEDADFIVDSDDGDLFGAEDVAGAQAGDFVIEDSAPSVALGEGESEYVVESGDTMMLIAFKLYGDYRMWKKVSSMNPGVTSTNLSVGQKLRYQAPVEPFVWNPVGLPHLIRSGETLGTISKDKYGTVEKWRMLWENNKPMIRNPNLIFAGFTLYYQPDRDVASEE